MMGRYSLRVDKLSFEVDQIISRSIFRYVDKMNRQIYLQVCRPDESVNISQKNTGLNENIKARKDLLNEKVNIYEILRSRYAGGPTS